MTIDNKLTTSEYGCILVDGGLDSALKYPQRKAVAYNNWAESDGIEPDLTTVEFQSKTVQFDFFMKADSKSDFFAKYRKLITDLSAPGYRTISPFQGAYYSLRYNAASAYTMIYCLEDSDVPVSFTLEFIDDFPTIESASNPTGGISLRGQYMINGVDFGAYGIGVDDDQSDLLKYPAMKEPFTDGYSVDLSTMTAKHKEFKLSCWMLADSVAEFWQNYRAFFTQLAKTGRQSLYIKSLGGSTEIYYTDCTAYAVAIWSDTKIATRFTLALTVPVVTWVDAGGTTDIRVLLDPDLGVLADEEGNVIQFN